MAWLSILPQHWHWVEKLVATTFVSLRLQLAQVTVANLTQLVLGLTVLSPFIVVILIELVWYMWQFLIYWTGGRARGQPPPRTEVVNRVRAMTGAEVVDGAIEKLTTLG